jgi:hypothetical protein
MVHHSNHELCHTPLKVRTPFVWEDVASNTSVIMDIHPGGYGGELPLINPKGNSTHALFSRDGLLCDCIGLPGLDQVMCYAFRGDNYGPVRCSSISSSQPPLATDSCMQKVLKVQHSSPPSSQLPLATNSCI